MSLSLFIMGMVPSVLIWVILADYLPAKTNKSNNTTNGFDTMPRAAKISQPSFMRRSSSVPCKTSAQNNRGSTSSSDSGFSPGSPNNATCMQTAAKWWPTNHRAGFRILHSDWSKILHFFFIPLGYTLFLRIYCYKIDVSQLHNDSINQNLQI